MSDSPPNYYAILEIAPTVTEEQIKTAYKKAALKWRKSSLLDSGGTLLTNVVDLVPHTKSQRV